MRSKLLLFAVAALPFSVALAAPDPELVALHQEIAALRVDHALNLTHDQAVALLPILRDAAAQQKARRDAFERSKPALVAALTQARDELRSTGTVSSATQQALAAARGSNPGTKPQLRTQLAQILTSEQLQALKNLKPMVAPSQSTTQPGTSGQGNRPHPFARRFFMYRTLTSDAFLALVQARAG